MITIVPVVPKPQEHAVYDEYGDKIGTIKLIELRDKGKNSKGFAFIPTENFIGMGQRSLLRTYTAVRELNLLHFGRNNGE